MKGVKTVLVIGGILLLVGVLILIIGFALGGGKTVNEFEMKRFEATEPVSRLEITGNVGNIVVEFSDEAEFISVDYPTAENTQTDVSVRGETFVFSGIRTPWWNFFGFFRFAGVPDTVITLPRRTGYAAELRVNAGKMQFPSGSYGNVAIEVNAGAFSGGELLCERLECNVSAGDLTVKSARCGEYEGHVSAGDLRIEALECDSLNARVSAGSLRAEELICPNIRAHVSAGDIFLQVVGKQEEYDVTTDRSAGSIIGVTSQRVVGAEKFMDLSVSAGKIVVEFKATEE